ncbi:hypothetical protein ACWDTT_33240 [Streptosporangium sandarakinum]
MNDGRECAICNVWKSAENFRTTPKGKLFSYCKPCHNEYNRLAYHEKKVLTTNTRRAPAGEDIKAATSSGRTCLKCDTWKAAANFPVVKASGNLFPYCNECWKNQQAAQYADRKDDPEYLAGFANRNRASKRRIKADVIAAYGGKCSCCGESTPEFLTLDHINNDGAAHRKELGLRTGHSTWSWARRNNYPDILQLLCWNCNSAKGAYGYCPHRQSSSN